MFIEDEEEVVGSDADEETTEEEVASEDPVEDESSDEEEETDETDWKAEALKYKSINARLSKKISKTKPVVAQPVESKTAQSEIEKIATQKARELLEERDLEALDLPEDLKSEVKKLAKLNNISVLKAAKDPYIQFKKEQIEKDDKIDDASVSRTNKSKATPKASSKPPQVDMSTEEGRKAFAEWEKSLK